jgi:hypothetical protein
MAGTFQSKVAQPFCASCDVGYWSLPASETCTICAPNYFLATKRPPAFKAVCKLCPDTATCDGGIYLPIPEKGYWSNLKSGIRDEMAIMYKCPSFMTCQSAFEDIVPVVENTTADDDDDDDDDDYRRGRRRLGVAKSCFEYDEASSNISKACLEPTKG